jgi:hypothetical protein
VDKYLGLLAAAIGRDAVAAEHHAAAAAAEDRLGARAWARRSRDELAKLAGAAARDETTTGNVFRSDGAVWTVGFAGSAVHLPDAKGLRDVATLLAVPGQPVHVFTLLGRTAPATGADPVLDEQAKAAFKARLVELDAEIDEAALWQDPERAERAKAERDALLRELATAAGLGGRDRRLGDEVERARKTVTARIREALRRIERVHPPLAAHLHSSLHTGTSCSYEPVEPTRWRL